MEFILLFVGLMIGAGIVWLLNRSVGNAREIDLLRRAESAETEMIALRAENKELTADNRELKTRLGSQDTAFENLANRILETQSRKFTEANRMSLDAVLKPLGEKMTEFRKRVEEVYTAETGNRKSLSDRVQELMRLNQQISTEASNLTRALKTDVKKMGCWGEVTLVRILEASGLVKDRDFFTEMELRDESGNLLRSDAGKKMRPDAIVRFPDDRNIIIDSKVSITAFVRSTETENEIDRKKALVEHVASVKAHIDELSAKSYDDYPNALDYVLMFIPTEAAYAAAVQENPGLWEYGYNKRVMVVNPMILMVLLKTVSDLWRREEQNKNVLKIAQKGGDLYDKFVLFLENFVKIGERLEQTRGVYEESLKQLQSGTGNLIRRAQELEKLGTKAKRPIPLKLLPTDDEEEEVEEEEREKLGRVEVGE